MKFAAAALGGAVVLLAVVLIAAELIAARVPQHRAALEDLIRHETGLAIAFSELSVRWGWYGPEAVFHSVVLGEPGAGSLLRAPQLVVSLDAWRMVRSGHLEAGRIMLVKPDIDLGPGGASGALSGSSAPPGREGLIASGPRLLSRWRGGRIDIEGGTLRWPQAGAGLPVTLNLSHAELRRLGADWSADVRVLLPDSLGDSARLVVRMSGDMARPQTLKGTLGFVGERLAFGGWHGLTGQPDAERYLPQEGNGNLDLQVQFADAQVLRVAGGIRAESLEWWPRRPGASALQLARLRGQWQLTRHGAEWRLGVSALDLGAGAPASATATVADLGQPGSARGVLRDVPLTVLAALARWYAPQLPLAEVALDGRVRELNFDWSAQRPAGLRLRTAAQVEELTLATAARDVVLSGLTAQVMGSDEQLVADVAARGGRLVLAREQPVTLDELQVATRLAIGTDGARWQLSTDSLEARRGAMSFVASGAVGADAPPAARRIDAQIAVRQADAALLLGLLGPRGVAALGTTATRLSAGSITSADFKLHGPLDALENGSRGAIELRAATLAGTDQWPEVHDLSARIDWQALRMRAAITSAQSGSFHLEAASAEWDARPRRAVHFSGRLSGSIEEALQWLRGHPQLADYAPAVQNIDLRGETLLDVDLTLPDSQRRPSRPRVRVTAVLDGVQLHPVAGLPAIAALRGTLAFAGGHLQHSLLTGQWLGGPVSLGVGERREGGASLLSISGRGFFDVRQAVLAAGGNGDDAMLMGNAEWSALLTVLPQADPEKARWRVRADSNLVGVTSRLPEPFAKPQNAVLPLHVELQAQGRGAQLRVSLRERLQALAALERSGEQWRIERGALRLAASAPALPALPVLVLEGRVGRLDLPAYLALSRQAGRDAALPMLEAHLTATQLLAGERSYPEVGVTARAGPAGGQLELQSAAISGTFRWPAVVDAAHPATVHLTSFDAERVSDTLAGAGLAAALGPAAQLAIEDLKWQGRSLGRFSALLGARDAGLELTEMHLRGANDEAHGTAHCQSGACRVLFSLESTDAAATLAAYGFRPDLSARRARLQGELQWLGSGGPLASLGGHLHMQLEEGATRADAMGHADAPLALLVVPALIEGMTPDVAEAARPRLRFAQLAANFALHDGQANTADLHFDGDAEILVRGRVGLLARDYEAQAFVLRGEERLPSAVRGLGPTPKVAAVWLSLREWLSGSAAERARVELRLRGSWNDPIVIPAQ